VFVEVFKAVLGVVYVIYAAPGSNTVFNAALHGKCLPTPALVSFQSHALHPENLLQAICKLCQYQYKLWRCRLCPQHLQNKRHLPTWFQTYSMISSLL